MRRPSPLRRFSIALILTLALAAMPLLATAHAANAGNDVSAPKCAPMCHQHDPPPPDVG